MFRLTRIAAVLLSAGISLVHAQISSGNLTGTVSDASGGSFPRQGYCREHRNRPLPFGGFRYRRHIPDPSFHRVFTAYASRPADSASRRSTVCRSALATRLSSRCNCRSAPYHLSSASLQRSPPWKRNVRNRQTQYKAHSFVICQSTGDPIWTSPLPTPGVVETTSMVDGTDFRVVQAPQSGLSFGGSNGRGNSFTIDGTENYINSGGVRPSVSQEAVAEFQVNRNSFSAEVGNAFGGAIQIITRSGTNQVRGNVFGFLRHRALQARNYFDPVSGGSAYTRSQAGATAGAPLQKDKTFVFAAYERLDRHETSFVPIIEDPTAFSRLTASQQQLLDFFNASGVPQLRALAQQASSALLTSNYPTTLALFRNNSGTFPYSENNNQFVAKLDHHLTTNHNAFLRLNFSDGQAEPLIGALLAYNRGRDVREKDYTTALGRHSRPDEHWIAETRGMFSHYTVDIETIDPNGPSLDIAGYGFFGRDIFLPSKIIERHWQASEVLSYTNGRHDVRFGFDYNPVRDNVYSATFFSGRFSFGEACPWDSC